MHNERLALKYKEKEKLIQTPKCHFDKSYSNMARAFFNFFLLIS